MVNLDVIESDGDVMDEECSDAEFDRVVESDDRVRTRDDVAVLDGVGVARVTDNVADLDAAGYSIATRSTL